MLIDINAFRSLILDTDKDVFKSLLWLESNAPDVYSQILQDFFFSWENGLPHKSPFSRWETEEERLTLIVKATCHRLSNEAEKEFFTSLPAADANDALRLMDTHGILISVAGHTYDVSDFLRRWRDYRPLDILPVAENWECE